MEKDETHKDLTKEFWTKFWQERKTTPSRNIQEFWWRIIYVGPILLMLIFFALIN